MWPQIHNDVLRCQRLTRKRLWAAGLLS